MDFDNEHLDGVSLACPDRNCFHIKHILSALFGEPSALARQAEVHLCFFRNSARRGSSCTRTPDSVLRSLLRLRWGLASIPLFSACSMASCCALCPTRSPTGSRS